MLWTSYQRKTYIPSYKERIIEGLQRVVWWTLVGFIVVYFLYMLSFTFNGVI